MMGRTTLREIREGLAAAKGKKGPKATVAPAVRELEVLTQVLKREAEEGTAAEKPRKKSQAESDAAANGAGHRGSRRPARSRSRRRR